MIEASPKLPAWRRAVEITVADQEWFTPFDGPVEVWVTFYLPRPKTVSRLLPTSYPDLDKLERGLFDALTKAGVWTDDSRVVDSHASKRYADDTAMGALVRVCEIDPTEVHL